MMDFRLHRQPTDLQNKALHRVFSYTSCRCSSGVEQFIRNELLWLQNRLKLKPKPASGSKSGSNILCVPACAGLWAGTLATPFATLT
jgi:hypothetical protein